MSILTKYIKNYEIDIPSDEWGKLNKEYSQEELINYFHEEIESNNITLPMRRLSLEDAEKSFISLLEYTCNDFFRDNVFSRYEYNLSFSGRYVDESNVGNIASDYFQQYNRFNCGSINAPSPIRTWNNRKFREGMLKALWTLKMKSVNSSSFRTCLSLRKYIASQYKPSIAKSIYEKYNGKHVLDFSSGWGDRLCGFYSCKNTISYTGIDPNINVYEKYYEQKNFYDEFIRKNCEFINKPAETVSFSKESYDTIFTSPPYFNVEKYTEDNNQSYKKFKKFDSWLEGFLYTVLENTYYALKKDGYLIINISDVYSGHKINEICNPMNNFLNSLGYRFIECIGMKLAKRPNSGALKNKEGIFVEPIWVWKK